jgi:nucleotide-binding universal stress UspA family protein
MAFSLALTHRRADDDALFGVHVTSRSDALALAERALIEYVGDCQADGRFVELRAAEADDVIGALADALEAFSADGLVLGREAPRDGSGFPRLGGIARKLLRTLPSPLFVVPADLVRVGAGPVIASTDLLPDSLDACRFAARIAALLERPLQLVHVAPSTAQWTGGALQPGELASVDGDALAEAVAQLEEFAALHRLPSDNRIVRQGEPIDELRSHIAAVDAAAIVLGSRRLGVLERLFTASVSTELAARASCPVAVVPPQSEPA